MYLSDLSYYSIYSNYLSGAMFIISKVKLSFCPFICHEISVWSSSFSLSQFGHHFLRNDSISGFFKFF